MKKILFILSLLLPFYGMATIYTWNSSNGNVLINRTNYPLAHSGDVIYIPPFVTGGVGYRSFTITNMNCGIIAPDTSQLIHVIWQSGAYIQPSLSSIFANSMDSLYGVEIRGMIMNDNIDVAFTTYANTGYSKYIWINHCTFQGMNGIFSSSIPSFSLSAFTGDSTNCFYHWRLSNVVCDSLVGGNSGNSAFRFGSVTSSKNQFWVNVEIDHCKFAYYSSLGGPANYIAGACCFGVRIHDDTVIQLGKNVPNPSGHAASVIIATGQVFMWNMYFGPDNFGNDLRILGNADLPGWFTGMPGTNGRAEVHNIFSIDKRKYPVIETRSAPSDTATLSPWVRLRTSPEVWNVTAYNLAVGVGLSPPSAYIASIVDCYENDSAWLKNSIFTVLRDTTWGNPAYMGLVTAPNGPITRYDTSNNRLIQFFAASGLADSVKYFPALNGQLYNQGLSVPSYITADIYGVPYPIVGRPTFGSNTGVDIGAALLVGSIINNGIRICVGCRIKFN